MGQQETKEMGIYPQNYRLVKEIFQYPYGQGKIMKNTFSKDFIYQITIESFNKNELQSTCKSIVAKQKQYSNPFILQLLNWNEEQTGLMFSNYHRVSLFYEYCPKTLAQQYCDKFILNREIELKKKQSARFTQAEVIYLLYAIVSVCLTLQKNNTSHKDIRPQTILLSHNSLRLVPVGTFPYDFDGYKKQQCFNEFSYISPEVQFNKSKTKTTDWSASDVYAAGLTLLDSIILEFSYDIIELTDLKDRQKLIFQKIGSVAKFYEFGLLRIISKMIETDESKRLNFEEIYDFLQPQKDKILEFQQIELPKQKPQRMVISPLKNTGAQQINQRQISPMKIRIVNETPPRQRLTMVRNISKQSVSPIIKPIEQHTVKKITVKHSPSLNSASRNTRNFYNQGNSSSPVSTQQSFAKPTLQITTQSSPPRQSHLFYQKSFKNSNTSFSNTENVSNEKSAIFPKFTITKDENARVSSVEIENEQLVQIFDHQRRINYKKLKYKLDLLKNLNVNVSLNENYSANKILISNNFRVRDDRSTMFIKY